MAVLFLLASTLLLIIIFVQDLKYRAVSWYLFPLTALTIWLRLFEPVNWTAWLKGLTINLMFLTLILALMLIWFFLKKINLKMILNQYLGIGDVLFFVVMAISLPFPDFPMVFSLSLLLSLVLALLIFRNKPNVPLAGLQSLCLIVYLALDHFQIISIHNWIY